MKRISTSILFSALVLALPIGASAKQDAPFGHATQSAPTRVIQLEKGKAMHINVKRFETIRFTDGETTLTWTFDTLGTPNFALSKIFPGAAGIIYVDESPYYAF